MSSAEAKEMLRSLVRAARRQGPGADAQALAAQCLAFVEGLTGPMRVTCYASYGTEPDTAPLMAALADRGFEVLVPRVVGDDLGWALHGGATAVSPIGIEEPVGDSVPLMPLRAMLIPALATGVDGARLGKGGGYYDRVLDSLPDAHRPVLAAIVRDEDVLPAGTVPSEAHDQRVDVIITPTRVIECSSD